MVRKQNKYRNSSSMFVRWTEETAYCYKRRCKMFLTCKDCPLEVGCKIGDRHEKTHSNEYGMRRLKYAVLATIKKIGFEGLEVFDYEQI